MIRGLIAIVITLLATQSLAATVSGASFSGSGLSASQELSVILVLWDDFGTDLDTRSGSTSTQASSSMPALDSMASGGTRFSDVSVNPACGTTRASLMLGQFSFRTGAFGPAFGTMPEDTSNHIARLSRTAGAQTVLTGKYFLPSAVSGTDYGYYIPVEHGFDYVYYMDNASPSPTFYSWTGFELTKDFFDTIVDPLDYYALAERTWTDGDGGQYHDSVVTTKLLEKYASRDRSRKFFGHLSLSNVHSPEHNPEDAGDTDCDPDPDGDNCRKKQSQEADRQLGRVLSAVSGDNTIVLLMGDNGTSGGFWSSEGKGTVAEGGVRVPFYAIGSGISAGAVDNTPISVVDISITIADLMGVTSYGGSRVLDGYSFVSLLGGRTCGFSGRCWGSRTGYIVSAAGSNANGERSIRDTDSDYPTHKLQHNASTGADKLFDLTSYPGYGLQGTDLCGGDGVCTAAELGPTDEAAFNYLCAAMVALDPDQTVDCVSPL